MSTVNKPIAKDKTLQTLSEMSTDIAVPNQCQPVLIEYHHAGRIPSNCSAFSILALDI